MNKKYSFKLYKYSAVFWIAAGIMLACSGCGRDETVSADAQTADESGGIDTAADSTSEDVGTADSGSTSEDVNTTDNGNTSEDVSAADNEYTIASQSSTDVFDTEMDPATRHKLMAELLEENEMDSSVVGAERITKNCTFDVPEGFEESQEVDNLYVTARYPLDASMIYYEVMDGDISLQLMTEEHFTKEAEEGLSQLYGEEITLNMESFESTKIDGYPAFRILCRYEIQGIEITQLEYIINADKTYAVTYSQTNDVDRMEEYEESAATIHVK